MAYNGSVELISGIKQKNNGTFPLVKASAVYVDDNVSLSDVISITATKNDLTTIKNIMVDALTDLKAAIEANDKVTAVAVLDQAILDIDVLGDNSTMFLASSNVSVENETMIVTSGGDNN